MNTPRPHRVEHAIDVDAPAQQVYDLVADVRTWPVMFGPTVHAEYLSRDTGRERLRLWAIANGQVRRWTSVRRPDPEHLTIDFAQDEPRPPLASMGGRWHVLPREGGCRVVLTHDYSALGDDRQTLDLLDDAVEHNSTAELSALKATAERGPAQLQFTFDDSVDVAGTSQDVYDFLYRADLWPQKLPHVAALTLTEPLDDVQVIRMETRAPDGSVHTTHSVRVCVPGRRIHYKQTLTPALLSAHTGEWEVLDTARGVRVTSRHTVVVNEAAIGSVVGAGAGVRDAVSFLHRALSTNSCVTLRHAKAFAETRSVA